MPAEHDVPGGVPIRIQQPVVEEEGYGRQPDRKRQVHD
jgi:hypothetical protein